MATAGDGRTPYQTTGAGGKLRKKPHRRNIPATPYDRPPTSLRNNNPNPSLLTKIVDPASRLISAGANRLFDVFRKRLPSLQAPPEINEEPQNVPPVGGQNGNFAANGFSDVEQMLQEKTFTRSEIQRLTALLHSRTTEPPSDDAFERERAKPLNSPSSLLRREASTSGSLKKYGDERDNLNATISTPIVSPRVREEITSPTELAKAYMGTRSTNVSPLFESSTNLAKTPTASVASKTANSFRNFENGFVTPRSRGRSAMYNMARTPYPRSPSVYTQKGTGSNYGQSSVLTSSQSAFGQERKMALKRRSSVLDDDIGSGGVLRRTRQKANLLSQRDKRELGYTASQQPDINSQKQLLTNVPEENGSGMGSGYGFVPSKSTQTATKILQQLEKPSPKERISGSSKSPTKLTLDMLHGQALRSLEKVDSPKLLSYPHDTQKTEVQHHAKLHDNRELTSKGKEKLEENGSKKFPIPQNMFTSVNGDLTVPRKDNAPMVTITDSPLKVPAESPQKKRAFQMSAPEDAFEMDDDDDEVPVNNGHVSSPLVENNKPEIISLVSNKPVSADVIETLTLPEPSRTPALVENNKPVFLEVTKVPEQTEVKETENSSSLKTVKFVTSPPSTTTTEPLMVPQSPLQMDKVAPEKESNIFSFGKTAENASTFKFSASEPSEVQPDATSDPKALESTSVFNSVAKDNHVKFALPNKEENGNENVNVNGNVNGNGKLESLFSAAAQPVAASKSDGFLFGNSTNNTSTPNTTPASSPPTFPSLVPSQASSGANTSSFFNNTSPSLTSGSTITSAPAASSIFSSSVPAPIFSFGSTTPKTVIAETGNNTIATNDKEVKPNTGSSPFASSSFSTTTTTTTTASGSGLFGFSVPAATSTTTETQANPQAASTAVTQSVPFAFGASSSSSLFGSSTHAFGSSTPAFGSSTSFGVSSIAASSEVKSDNSTSGPVFGSTWPAAPESSGFGSTFASSPFSFGAVSSTATPATTTPITFGSSFPTAGATNSSFATPQSKPLFGNPTPLFGASTVSPNNNDQMSMEDSMAEDSMQTPSPVSLFGQAPVAAPVSSFGQAPAAAPGFMFGSATPTPTQPPAQAAAPGFTFGSATPTPTQPPANAGAPGFSFGSATPTPTQSTVPFQFGGQPNQTPPQNPFQSSSLEFNGGGGSFSLGSTDKSGRRIVKIKKNNRGRK